MSFQNEKDADRRRRSDQPDEVDSSKKPQKKKSAGSNEVGSALRTIYQRTIDEDVPPDLLDLLGKLG